MTAERDKAQARRLVDVWNSRVARGADPLFYPTIGAAIAAGRPWLSARVDRKPDPRAVLPRVLSQPASNFQAASGDKEAPVAYLGQGLAFSRVCDVVSLNADVSDVVRLRGVVNRC